MEGDGANTARTQADAVNAWRHCFRQWPADVERRGVLVTSFDEQIPFDGFSASEQLLLVDRRTPDTLGARKVMVGYQHIVALKITDVLKTKAFQSLGFEDVVRPPKKPGH